MIGMTMLSGLKKSGEEYVDGEITAPTDGKVYRSKAWLTENGKKLQVRGYVGLPMVGCSQTWLRQE